MANSVRGIRTFRALVKALAKEHHHGHYYPMAKRVGVSSATVDQWQAGVIKKPGLDSIVKLCAAYDLELLEVMQMLGYRAPVSIGGGSGSGGTLPLLSAQDAILLIGHRYLHRLWAWLTPTRVPTWAPA